MRADLICDADGVSIAGTPFKFQTFDALVDAFSDSLKTPWQVFFTPLSAKIKHNVVAIDSRFLFSAVRFKQRNKFVCF